MCERGGGGQEGHGTVHVPDEVDKLPLVVDAFLLRDGLLLFPLSMEVGEDEGAGRTATDRHQSQDTHQDDVEADAPVRRVRHGTCRHGDVRQDFIEVLYILRHTDTHIFITWTVLTNAGILEAHALVTIETLRAGTHVSALCAVAGYPLLAGVGIAKIQ